MKSVDYDGTVEYFNVVKVRRNGSFDDSAIVFKPNPVSNNAVIEFSSITTEPVQIIVLDVDGRIVKKFNQTIDENTFEVLLDLETLESGVYFVNINSVYMNEMIKFIKL